MPEVGWGSQKLSKPNPLILLKKARPREGPVCGNLGPDSGKVANLATRA